MSESNFESYDTLVHGIYEAALEPERWPRVLQQIETAWGGFRSQLFTPLHSPTQGGLVFRSNISEAMTQRWAAVGIQDDPITRTALARGIFADGNTVNGRDLVSEQALLDSRLYNDLWLPMGIGHVCSGVVFAGTDSKKLPTVLSIYRRLTDPPFNEQDSTRLRPLVRHMSRSLGVMFHLRNSELKVAASRLALDQLKSGVFVLEAEGGLQFANAAGKVLLNGEGVLQTVRRQTNGAPDLALAPALQHFDKQFRLLLAGMRPAKSS